MSKHIVYNGFIKVDVNRFYPISRIKEICHYNCSARFTEIIFDDDRGIIVEKGLLETIDMIKNK